MSYRSASARAAAFDQAVREAMSATIPNGVTTEPPAGPVITAGAHEPECVTVKRVATHPTAGNSDFAAPDRDRVEHPPEDEFSRAAAQAMRRLDRRREEDRLARLRRWQAVGGQR